jgi:hypothetical protein
MLSRAQQSPLGRLKGNKFKAPLGYTAFFTLIAYILFIAAKLKLQIYF